MKRGPVAGVPISRPPWARQPGLMMRLLAEPRAVLDQLRADIGPIVGLGAGPMRMAVVGDPVALRELFATPTDDFRWGHRYNVLSFVVGPRSLIVSDGADWRRRRSSLRAGFSRRRLNGWVDTIVTLAGHHIDALLASTDGSPTEIDLDQFGRELVQEIVVRVLFGEQLATRASEIAERFRAAQDYLESPFYRQLPHPLPIGRRSRVRADMQALRAIVGDQIARLRAEPTDDPLDVLAALVAEGALTDAEIVDQVITLMGAGLDTTSATLSWMLWCTALAGPDLWSRLRAEADGVLGSGPFADSHLARLELAEHVVRETTRLHPAGSFSPRMANVDVVVGGHRIPKGTLILWSAHLAGRDAGAWDDPLTFDPDRFTRMTPEQRATSALAWVPFGRGERNCIGFALAQMELTLILARMAQRLDVEATAPTAPRAVGMVVNRPEGGAPMRVSSRVSDTGRNLGSCSSEASG